MKLCPGCHQETFDGRATCHRCGRDVSEVQALDLPLTDPATLVKRLPLASKSGTLQLATSGVRFVSTNDEELLSIPASELRSVDPRGTHEMVLRYQREGDDRSARVRVRWAPRAEQRRVRQRQDIMLVSHSWRPITFRATNRKRNMRDREIVRDRWLYAMRRLLEGDRYALGRASASWVESGL